jgi:WD40 repeat protein
LAAARHNVSKSADPELATVEVWDTATRRHLASLWEHGIAPRTAAFAPGGQTLATGGGAESLHLWRVADWGLRQPLGRPLRSVWSLAFTPDGTTLITGSQDEPLERFTYVRYPVLVAKEKRAILGVGGDAVRLWDVASGKALGTVAVPHPAGVRSLDLAGGGRTLFAGTHLGTAWVLDLPARRCRSTLLVHRDAALFEAQRLSAQVVGLPVREELPEGEAVRAALSPDRKTLATACDDGALKLWDVPGEQPRLLNQAKTGYRCVAWSPKGEYLAAALATEVRLWDVTESRLAKTIPIPSGRAVCLAWSADGAWLACGTEGQPGGQVILHKMADASQRVCILRDGVEALAFVPGAQLLMTGDRAGHIRVWDYLSQEPPRETFYLGQHAGPVRCFAFAPGGKLLASGGEDRDGVGEVFLWDLEQPPLVVPAGGPPPDDKASLR